MTLAMRLLPLLLLVACATPQQYTDAPMTPYDQNTKYSVTKTEGGFTLTVLYDRYQYIPESDAVIEACTRTLTSLAYELAEGEGRTIEPVNEQRIRMSAGRNGFTGITSCSATVPIRYSG